MVVYSFPYACVHSLAHNVPQSRASKQRNACTKVVFHPNGGVQTAKLSSKAFLGQGDDALIHVAHALQRHSNRIHTTQSSCGRITEQRQQGCPSRTGHVGTSAAHVEHRIHGSRMVRDSPHCFRGFFCTRSKVFWLCASNSASNLETQSSQRRDVPATDSPYFAIAFPNSAFGFFI